MGRNFKLGELFCGPGGIALGSAMSKYKNGNSVFTITSTWASDHDHDTCETYARNIHGCALDDATDKVFESDIRNLDFNRIPGCDGLAFGFPCNDFSNVGETKGLDGNYGPLYSYGVKYINKNNPKFIFAENVSGISSANSGGAFKKILDELNHAGRHGYELTTHLYKFEEYGIPQARHRYIIVGIRKDLKLKFKIPVKK